MAEVKRALSWAQLEALDIVCFPECFLTGYYRTSIDATARSIDLNSALFSSLVSELKDFDSMVILGLIERAGSKLYNSAVILEKGKMIGCYRKQHLIESAFEPGHESPVFEKNGLKFGVNICYDANFPESAKLLAERGAQAIFYPLSNILPPETARKWRSRHIQILSDRARDCSVWVVSSDVVGSSPSSLGYGCTAIIDPTGSVVARCPELKAGRVKSFLLPVQQHASSPF